MSTVIVPQTNPNDEVTALSVNQGANAIAAVLNGNVDDANVSALSGNKISAGTLPVSAFDASSNPETRESETTGDFVSSGLVWSATTGLGGTMTAGTAYINGKRLTPASVASYTFTASRDTYVYLDATGAVQYNAQTNGAAQPATPASNITLAKVVTSASAVTSVTDMRQVGAVVSNVITYVEGLTTGITTTSASYVDTGLSVTFKAPTGCQYVIMKAEGPISSSSAGIYMPVAITDNSNVIQIERGESSTGASAGLKSTFTLSKRISVTPGTMYTFKLRYSSNGSATVVINNGNLTTSPTMMWIERAS